MWCTLGFLEFVNPGAARALSLCLITSTSRLITLVSILAHIAISRFQICFPLGVLVALHHKCLDSHWIKAHTPCYSENPLCSVGKPGRGSALNQRTQVTERPPSLSALAHAMVLAHHLITLPFPNHPQTKPLKSTLCKVSSNPPEVLKAEAVLYSQVSLIQPS